MKYIKFLLIIFLVCQSMQIFAQCPGNKCENEWGYFLQIVDLEYVPSIVSTDEMCYVTLQSGIADYDAIFSKYKIIDFYQYVPTAHSEWLRQIYVLVLEQEPDQSKLAMELQENFSAEIPYIEERYCNVVSTSENQDVLLKNNLWSVLEEDNSPPGFPDTHPYKLSHWLKTGNDTILNGKTYKNILYSTDASHLEWEGRGLFLREEEGRVYWCDQAEPREEETLLYDFNLQEGESIIRYLAPDWDVKIISTVDSIRSIQIGDSLRKIFYISNTLDSDSGKRPEIWIEGIGSLVGLERNNIYSFTTGCNVVRNLLCFNQDGNKLYHSPDFDDCYYSSKSGIQTVKLTSDFQIYPNPSQGKFTLITDDSDEDTLVQIFDSTGKQIRSYPMGTLHLLNIDISNVFSGIYFVRLIKQNTSITKKIVMKFER